MSRVEGHKRSLSIISQEKSSKFVANVALPERQRNPRADEKVWLWDFLAAADDDKMPFSCGADTAHRPPHASRQSFIGWLSRLSIAALHELRCLPCGSHGIYVDPTFKLDVIALSGTKWTHPRFPCSNF
ncbi:hypothetical protein SADUNF_Sadunf04G0078600 [Salix dunnii]|uniref:Uncharacterized protein n=1 Tax=Salix dunnii TaxID=1413687 RepID=A0A835K4G8_9ROSI|nr:hypothetical protein SADUNF_Sadunf04G0078600 [Salix dunnii]